MSVTLNLPDSLSSASVLSMWESRELCDLSLVSQEEKLFPCHKLVLSAHSPVLRRILASPALSSPGLAPALVMFGLSSAEVGNILQFLYTGQVILQTPEVHGFMSLAERLEISNISEEEKDDIRTRKRQRPPKKFYSKEGIKKVKDTLNIKHVLKVEVNNDNEVEMIDPPGIPQRYEDLLQYGKSATIGTLNEVPEPMENTVMEIKSLRENQSFVKVRIDENEMSQHKNFKSFLHSFHTVLEDSIFKCNLCGDVSVSPSEAEEHSECHIEGLKFPCKLCKIILSSRKDMRMHLAREHQPRTSNLI